MRFSPPPDFSSNRRLVLAALAVTLITVTELVLQYDHLAKTLGGGDDALRLVMVRDLMAGRGWYDQLLIRLQPPLGTYMHWSRLLDGVLAALIWVFRLALTPAAAEMAVRLSWPLILILPTVVSALAIARRLGGSLAVFICAIFLASNQLSFAQFIPGRIDHHNVQIALVMIATSCAMAVEQRSRWALWAGASNGLGLSVGLEGLLFHVMIGTSYWLLAAWDRDNPRTTRNYAAALLVTTVACYCLQTPPWRWGMSFCDSIGANLVSAIAFGACGLLIATAVGGRVSVRGRLIILGMTALAVPAAYLALDPRCVHGAFAEVDPRIMPVWLASSEEIQPLLSFVKKHPDLGIALILMSAMILAAAIFLLVREWPRPRPATWLASLATLAAVTMGCMAFRMGNYVQWLGIPVLASAFSVIATRYWRGLMAPTAVFAVLFSPVSIVAFALPVASALQGYRAMTGTPVSPAPQTAEDSCLNTPSYRQLAALRPGLVLGDIYMGPFILANTPHAVLAAPYHRMSWGILAAHATLTASSSRAEAMFRTLAIDYLVECPRSSFHPTAGSIEADIARGKTPAWLEPLSASDDALQIYRVRTGTAALLHR